MEQEEFFPQKQLRKDIDYVDLGTLEDFQSGSGVAADDISAGDVVTNITTGLVSTVTSVVSNTVLALDSNIFLASANSYGVFSSSTNVQAEKVINNKRMCIPSTSASVAITMLL